VRYLPVAILCLAAGFGAGWLTFDSPFGNGPSGPSKAEVEAAVSEHATGDVQFTACGKLASPPNVWDCTAYILSGPSNDALPIRYRATVNGSAINVEQP
jgi:hypothetical protein